ncbi:MAG: SRPBCC family protein [Pseudoclavibacter sp.]
MQNRSTVIVGSIALVALVAGIGVRMFVSPPTGPPAYEGERPQLRDNGYVSLKHSVVIDASPANVRTWIEDPSQSLDAVVTFDDGFPAVVATHPIRGSETVGKREGHRRAVEFEDGHFLAEEILVDTPERFQYTVWGFTRPEQRIAVHHGVAEFTYEPEGAGTRVSWTYELMPTTPLVRPAVESFMTNTMDAMMRATLDGMRRGVEDAT